MKRSLYQRLAISVSLAFIAIVCLLFWYSDNLAGHSRHQAEQQLHMQLAAHLAQDNPLLKDGVYDKPALENLFHTLMVLGPAFEFYYLDPTGNILTYSAKPEKIKRKSVDLTPLVSFISKPQNTPVYGDDPKSHTGKKIFSVAPIFNNEQLQGYLYVIIGGEIYDSVLERVNTDQLFQQFAGIVLASLFLVLLLLLVLFRFFTKPICALVADMEKIKASKFTRTELTLTQWQNNNQNEVQLLGHTFTEMVDIINEQFTRLSENERIRKELLAHLSHDLRTPLAAIQGYVETMVIKNDNLSITEQKIYLNTVLKNACQLKQLIDQIFELAHLEDGQVSINLETFPIGELIHDIVAKFSLKASDKNITLSLKPKQCSHLVYSDIAKIERILSNLIDNALRHTPDNGEISLEVTQAQDKIIVAVTDNGSGISQDDIAYIFDARYRASNATEDKQKHAGLGLAICKKLSVILNSDIKVTSCLGQGSRFTFHLKAVITS
ncbi:MAG: HAMP domain-containing sensor histidine kinase [Litorilituus sp.]|nr:HAMP domain-containing sensor histidine kinase [Litorilituus sp.]